jgi:hypothetical protein
LIWSMSSTPRRELALGPALFSLNIIVPFMKTTSSRRTEASQPYIHNQISTALFQ